MEFISGFICGLNSLTKTVCVVDVQMCPNADKNCFRLELVIVRSQFRFVFLAVTSKSLKGCTIRSIGHRNVYIFIKAEN